MNETFEEKLEKYADLIVHVGLNIQPGQNLLITNASLDNGVALNAAPLVRKVVKRAYQAGARYVEVQWSDEEVMLARFKYAPRDSFDALPEWRSKARLDSALHGDALLSIVSSDPSLLSEQDPHLVSQNQRTRWAQTEEASKYVRNNAINWSIAAAAGERWAARLFPELPAEKQMDRLWEVLFAITRVDRPDPVAAWQEHKRALRERGAYLNHKQYDRLHFRAPGTDLYMGLAEHHIWRGGQSTSAEGIPFTANIPTEEVFTLPHSERTEGVVAATLPLNLGGALVEDFSMRFESGVVVEAHARVNEELLLRTLDTDEGARRLGEGALVPFSSPIAQSGILFYNTLLDENASSHLALGSAYRSCIEGGVEMTEEEFNARGGNKSLIHIDFMIGSDRMDVDGLTASGDAEPLMRQGEWTFEV